MYHFLATAVQCIERSHATLAYFPHFPPPHVSFLLVYITFCHYVSSTLSFATGAVLCIQFIVHSTAGISFHSLWERRSKRRRAIYKYSLVAISASSAHGAESPGYTLGHDTSSEHSCHPSPTRGRIAIDLFDFVLWSAARRIAGRRWGATFPPF